MRSSRRGLVVYQLLLILLGLAILVWLAITFLNRPEENAVPDADTPAAVIDTAPVPVPPVDSAPVAGDSIPAR